MRVIGPARGPMGKWLSCTFAVLTAAGILIVAPAAPAHADCSAIHPAEADWIYAGPPPNWDGTQRVVDVANWGKTDRSAIHLWHWRSGECDYGNQLWKFQYMGSVDNGPISQPFGELINPASNKCLDKSQDKADADGNAVYLYTCRGTSNQLWRVRAEGTDSFELINMSDDRCLDIAGYGWSDGSTIWVWTCTYAWNQRWYGDVIYLGLHQ